MTPRQSFSSHPRIRDAAALGFTSSLGPFAANGIMPGFHAMAEDFGVSFVAVQQSLTIYLFTYAFFSLVAGSFSDSYGRRPTFIGGMLLFAAASLQSVAVGALRLATVARHRRSRRPSRHASHRA